MCRAGYGTLVTPRSASNRAVALAFMEGPRSACRVSWPGKTPCLAAASSNSGLNKAALSASAQLLATLLHLAVLVEDAIHGPDRAMIEALVQQLGVDFRRGLVDEPRFAQQIEDGRRSERASALAGRRRGRTGAEGRRAVAIRRWKLARDRPSAAQAAPISPRPGGRAATASIRTPRRRASTGPAAKPLFLDFDNRLGALQAQRHALVVALQLRMFGRQRVGLGDLGAALDRLQRLAGAGVALPTPIRQQRGIEPLAPQDRANAARPRLIDLAEYPKLVGARERPTAWPVGEFRRGRRWRSNKARPTASLCCGAIGKSLFEGDERHDHGRM